MKMNRSKIVFLGISSILLGAGIAYQNCGQIHPDSNQDPTSKTFTTSGLRESQNSKDAAQTFQKPAAERGFAELVKDSGVIFQGKAISAHTSYSEDKEIIYTHVKFINENVIKGSISESEVELRFIGGTMGDETLKVPGMPYFEKDKSYVLFLHGNINPYRTISPVYGMEAGQFLIKQEEDKTERMYLPHGAKIIGYDKNNDKLDTAYLSEARKNIPRAENPNQDKVVDPNNPKKLAQAAMTKDQFTQLIADIVKESGDQGVEFRNLKEDQKNKGIVLSIVKAPEGVK